MAIHGLLPVQMQEKRDRQMDTTFEKTELQSEVIENLLYLKGFGRI